MPLKVRKGRRALFQQLVLPARALHILGGGKVQISSDRGTFPRWRRDGREILYLNGEGMLVSVPVSGSGARFAAEAPRPLFPLTVQPGPGSPYDVTPDGQRIIANVPLPSNVPQHLTVIVNWPALVRR